MTTPHPGTATPLPPHPTFKTHTEARRWALRHLATPWRKVRNADEVLARNPRPSQKFHERHHLGELRTWFGASLVFEGIEAVADELECAAVHPAVGRIALETYNHWNGRRAQFDRGHDLTEFVPGLVDAAAYARHARQAQLDGDPVSLLWHGGPKLRISALASAATARWLPAIQNIFSRLPPGERQAAADEAQAMLRRYLGTLSQAYTLVGRLGDERKRWERGIGAIDVVIWESLCMVGYAKEMAERMPDDDTDQVTAGLKYSASQAMASAVKAWDKLSEARLAVLSERVWFKNKSEMVEWARSNGGIGPDLEAMLHTRGSKFVGY